ncbi:hypothetical protein LOD99_6100 [Oopsacas minuta]|uniref:Mevalonate kinase n=1 Tax=Oopsacas minuta TaxID=111878 RepID=A0AAV7JNA5_9METZ|nr:hypothetical protein LOD99_6100 [Oopsacas minuta]
MAECLPTTYAVSCPAKIILHGEHAVVYGKAAIGTSIDLRTYAILKNTRLSSDADNVVISFKMPQIDVDVSWPLDSIKSKVGTEYPEMLDELKTLASQADSDSNSYAFVGSLVFVFLFASICGKTDLTQNVCVEVDTEAPLGSGLGSSAALSVCVSALFLVLANNIQLPSVNNMDITIAQLKNAMSKGEMKQGYFTRENLGHINNWGFAAERIVHGNPSGIDNALCTHGGTMRFIEGQFTSLKAFSSDSPISLVVIDSCIPKSTQKMIFAVKDKQMQIPKIFDPIFASIDAISERCCQEFNRILSENSAPDYKLLEDLIFINHQLLCAIGVSRLELDNIHQFTQRLGFVSKVTGSGGGGCMLALVTPENEKRIPILKDALTEKGFKSWQANLGVQGICYHLPSNSDT